VIKSNCQTATTTSCPTTTPSSAAGSKFDYMHLWAAGELAVRKSKLDTRAGVLRTRLQCGINDANNGFAGFAMMMLGYLGEDAGARTFIEGKITAGGDLGSIAKAAILLMGNADDMTKYKADVTSGTTSSSIFVKAACAAALGIAAKDDATVKSIMFPLAQWIEPDPSGGGNDNGQSIYAAQLINLVAWDRRGWAPLAGDTGAVSFYGETGTSGNGGNGGGTGGATGLGGASGSAGSSGNKDASPGSDAKVVTPDTAGNGGATGIGGAAGNSGTAGTGGKAGAGGATSAGGTSVVGGTTGATGAASAGGTTVAGGTTGSAGSKGTGGSNSALGGISGGGGEASGSGGDTGSGTTPAIDDTTGCKCNLGGHTQSTPSLSILAMAGLALFFGRRRRR
jgi:MYXO-CTERM domain-containing protein